MFFSKMDNQKVGITIYICTFAVHIPITIHNNTKILFW